MRFAMRSRRGPHAPIGHNAPKVMLLCAVPLCSYNGDAFFRTMEHSLTLSLYYAYESKSYAIKYMHYRA